MSGLLTEPRLDQPDALFEALVEAHRELAPEASRRLDAKLIFLLANHIGSVEVVLAALGIAQESGLPPS